MKSAKDWTPEVMAAATRRGQVAVSNLVRAIQQDAQPETPDPITLGEELASYIKKRFDYSMPALVTLGIIDGGGNHHVTDQLGLMFMEKMWECQFWQAKALGSELP